MDEGHGIQGPLEEWTVDRVGPKAMNGAFIAGFLLLAFGAGPIDEPPFWLVLAGAVLMVIGLKV